MDEIFIPLLKFLTEKLITIHVLSAIDPQTRSGCHGNGEWWNCCTSSNQCGEGEGDCDSDADCVGNLKCGQGSGFDDNCGSGFASDADCCYDPNGKRKYITNSARAPFFCSHFMTKNIQQGTRNIIKHFTNNCLKNNKNYS